MLHRPILHGFVMLALAVAAAVVEASAQCGEVPQPARPASAPGASGGIPINFTRQATSRSVLSVKWDFPTRVADRDNKPAHVLPRAQAFVTIAGEDKRPVLVLRECDQCKGTDFAFLDRKLNNEKTMLLARWFHCVKLPPGVVQPTHRLHSLFADRKPPHLFLAKVDGSEMEAFDGEQSQSALQAGMVKLIKTCYEKDPKPALKQMLIYLSQFDDCDTMEKTLLQQIKAELYAKGPNSSKLKKLNARLDAVKARRTKAMKRADAVCDLELKATAAPTPQKVITPGRKQNK
jgi:hypothetical protein